MNIVFTLCSNNYLAQAITLGNSLLKFNPAYQFRIGLVDRKDSAIDYSAIPYEIIEVENIGITGSEELYKKFNITELNTAVKPFYFHYFFSSGKDISSVIYLDPDIIVYSSLNEIESSLEDSDIIITPHFTTPLNDNKLQSEEDFLNTGLYNLGFIAIKNSNDGNKMINWWAERLRNKAFIDLKRGLFTDQIWINFVPLFFKNVKIFNHPGYNMAYWNLHERNLSKKAGEYFVNEIYPLVFYHFSGFSPLVPELLSKYQDRFAFADKPGIRELFVDYSDKLFLNSYEAYIGYKNVFEKIKNKIDLEERKTRVHSLPFLIRMFRIVILKVSKKHDLLLD